MKIKTTIYDGVPNGRLSENVVIEDNHVCTEYPFFNGAGHIKHEYKIEFLKSDNEYFGYLIVYSDNDNHLLYLKKNTVQEFKLKWYWNKGKYREIASFYIAAITLIITALSYFGCDDIFGTKKNKEQQKPKDKHETLLDSSKKEAPHKADSSMVHIVPAKTLKKNP